MKRRCCTLWVAGLGALLFATGAAAQTQESTDETAHKRPSWENIEPELLPKGGAAAAVETEARAHESTAPSMVSSATNGSKPLQNREREKQPLARSATTVTTSGSWTRTLLSLAVVVGLVLLLAWGYRSVAMGATPLTTRARGGGVIQIVGRQAISPRHAVCLVRVGPRLVVVGQSPDRLTQLDVIEDAALVSQLVGESGTLAGRREAAQFQQQLEREAAEYERQPAAGTTTPVQGALRRMQAALKQAVGE